ncbi:MAG: type II toxin-antitoxin system VapC family toxin [Campylobacterota bacterium]|nr:type II toxin-antitoxin system VapC family toxin [Campylobacterota bacterium]
MSGNRVILDSNIIIYLSQKKLSLDEVFDQDVEYAISIITYMEILSFNFTSLDEEKFIKELLGFFEIIDIDYTIANRVIELKKRRKIKLPDAIIVASALLNNSILYTNDQ